MPNNEQSNVDSALPVAGPSVDDQPIAISGNPLTPPDGIVVDLDTTQWYRLKAKFVDDHGNVVSGYAYPVGTNPSDSFWDYISMVAGPAYQGALKFKVEQPDDQGWSRWTIHDDSRNEGYYMSCKATGWLYRATGYDVKFKIVGDQLFCNYWGGPVGSIFRSFLVSAGNYLGMGLPPLTACEMELVKP